MAQAIPAIAAVASNSAVTTTLAVASTAVGTYAAVNEANYRSQVARNNAVIAEENRLRTLEETAINAQEQDLAARAEIGALLAQQGASGLSMGVGSMALRRKSAEELAAKDRSRITYEGQTVANQYEQQREDFKEESRMAKSEVNMAMLEGAIGIGSSLIGGATKVNNKKARALGRT